MTAQLQGSGAASRPESGMPVRLSDGELSGTACIDGSSPVSTCQEWQWNSKMMKGGEWVSIWLRDNNLGGAIA